jgi:two-component system, repressor protein LuxO
MTPPGGRILLVEDTPTQAEVAKAHLRELNHTIRVAETAAALEHARARARTPSCSTSIAGRRRP